VKAIGRRQMLSLGSALFLAACAQTPQRVAAPGGVRTLWSGRLSLRVDSDPVQSMTAGFDLRGSARQGELALYTPLGSTLARMVWAPGEAELQWNGQRRNFESMEALTQQATGTALPLDGLFLWLSGEPAQVPGWSADLRDLGDGKLVARRSAPLPAVEMRLVFE
jgi:outer membrane lipoprotein LolB